MTHHELHRFCSACGGVLESRTLKPGTRAVLVCTDCGAPCYLDPKVAACSLIEENGGIVLLRRAIQPQKGLWVLPGGFVDRGETVEGAAVRETLEECGLETDVTGLLGVYSYPGETVVIVVFTAAIRSGTPEARDETLEARIIRPGDIPWEELAFQSTRDALTDYGLKKRPSLL